MDGNRPLRPRAHLTYRGLRTMLTIGALAMPLLLLPAVATAHCCVCAQCSMEGLCTDDVPGTSACMTLCANVGCPRITFETESDCSVGCITHSVAGDCNGDGRVTVDELVLAVAKALGQSHTDCPGLDLNEDGTITVDELIAAVNQALRG